MLTLFAFLGALGILVTLHELGHYLVARYFGVRVIRFSVGFGRPLYTWRRSPSDTEWALCWIPLGGYVRMADERDDETLVMPGVSPANVFNRKPVLQRMAIVVAGPLMNLAVACLFYGVLHWQERTEAVTIMAAPPAGSLAERAGLQAGDRLLEVNGRDVRHWSQVHWESVRSLIDGDGLSVSFERSGVVREAHLSSEEPDWPTFTPSASSALGLHPIETAVTIGRVVDGSAGAQAGLQAGDRLLTLDGDTIESTFEFTQRIRANPGRELELEFERDGRKQRVAITPQSVTPPEAGSAPQGRLGVGLRGDYVTETYRLGVLAGLAAGARQTWDMSVFSLVAFYRMLDGSMSWRMLGGPVTIADAAGQSAQVGLSAYIGFLAMLSVSLGVLNLLPVPVLDGGHLMYYLVELLTGSPVSERWMEWGQKVGLLMIGLLTALALINDLSRFL